MKYRVLQYLPYANHQTLKVVLVVLTLAAMVLAGGAPECTSSASCGG